MGKLKKIPYYGAMVALIGLFWLCRTRADSILGGLYSTDGVYIDIVATVLAIVAGVAFWMEYRGNERLNEAQLIVELNEQFLSNGQFTAVELKLERYYVAYRTASERGEDLGGVPFEIDLDVLDEAHQALINYLVYLEGIAALIDEGVIRIKAIRNLMSYRYFIAVNNPHIQEKELLPYREHYKGIFSIYDDWSKELGEENVPMNDNALSECEARKMRGCVK